MELVIKPFHSSPCRLEVFTINGKNAEQNDFGDMYDVILVYFNKILHIVYIFKIKRYKDNNNFREASKQNDIFKIKHFILSSLASHLTILQRI